MTIPQIKAMFAPGQTWTLTRLGFVPLTIHGNLGTSTMPPPNYSEVRVIHEVRAGNLITRRPNGTPSWAPWPKASEIIEARPGYLQWKYTGQPGTLTWEQQTTT